MRQCGDCQLCCRLLPVRTINKPGGVKCRHQKFGVGCKVYAQLATVSPECSIWNCRWLVNDDCDDLRRPDRSHYVIDLMPDFVTVVDNITGEKTNWQAIQVWVDPKHPEAADDPALRAFIYRRAETDSAVAIIRLSPNAGYCLIAPPMASDGEWHRDDTPPQGTHSPQELWEGLASCER